MKSIRNIPRSISKPPSAYLGDNEREGRLFLFHWNQKVNLLNADGNSAPERLRLFATLASEAAACTRCPAMCERTAILSELNGPVEARIMFIGEAPGRKGADRTRMPFSGDQSGKNLDRFIASIGLRREQLFITSAALCNPRTESGANRKPSQSEVANCSGFLRRTIELVNPGVIVTLGSVALEALKRIKWHEFALKDSVGEILKWNDRLLVPIYHPSPQVLASHRREAAQLEDYKIVARAIRRLTVPGGTRVR